VAISLTYKILTSVAVKDSAVYIVLDKTPIFKLLPSDNGQRIGIRGKVSSGTHTLGFCTAGSLHEAPHQVAI
jgi:hypothetical protein